MASKISTMVGEDCPPCADSNLSLKEQIAQLGNKQLVEGNENKSNQTGNGESLYYLWTKNSGK